MTNDEEFWSNRFHRCALAAGFLAASEGRLSESRYVQQLAYELYERGAFREPAVTRPLTADAEAVNDLAISNSYEPNNATEEEGPAGASHRGTRRSPGEESRQAEGSEGTQASGADDPRATRKTPIDNDNGR